MITWPPAAPRNGAGPPTVHRRQLLGRLASIKRMRAARRLAFLLIALLLLPLASACQPFRPPEPTPSAEPTPLARPLTPEEIFKLRRASVVLVRAEFPATAFSPPSLGNGSGTVIAINGQLYILSAAHVVEGSNSISVFLPGSNEERAARVVGISSCDDLALLSVADTSDLVPAPLGRSADLENGQAIVLMGYPLNVVLDGTEPSISDGIVSQRDLAYEEFPSVVQHSAESDGGYSGGPLFNRFGELMGVHVMRLGQSIRFAVSSDYAQGMLGRLAAGERPHYLGMNLRPLALDDGTQGILVDGVDTGSPAARAGINPADLLLTLEGAGITAKADLCRVLRSRDDGDAVRLELARLVSNPPAVLAGQLTINQSGDDNWLRPEPGLGTAPTSTGVAGGGAPVAPTPVPTPTPVSASDGWVTALNPSAQEQQQLLADYQQLYEQAEELRFERFDNPDTRRYWNESDTETFQSRFDDYVYKLTVKTASVMGTELLRVAGQPEVQLLGSSYLVEAAVDLNGSAGGSAGLLLDGQANGDSIVFMIKGNGTFSVATWWNKELSPEYTLPGTSSAAILPGTNQLKVAREAEQVVFWINDTPVAVMQQPPFDGGAVGVVALAAQGAAVPLTVFLDDFRVRER